MSKMSRRIYIMETCHANEIVVSESAPIDMATYAAETGLCFLVKGGAQLLPSDSGGLTFGTAEAAHVNLCFSGGQDWMGIRARPLFQRSHRSKAARQSVYRFKWALAL